MENIVIVAAGRTPVGSFGGGLSEIPAAELGAAVIKKLMERCSLSPTQIDEVIMGQVLTEGVGQNPARQAAIFAGIDIACTEITVNMVCGSGLKSIQLACQALKCQDAEIIIAGGQENMSMAPHVLPSSRKGKKMGDWCLEDSMLKDGLIDVFNHYHMGVTAENVAEKYNITREDQDKFAFLSQQKCKKALETRRFVDEIIPVPNPNIKRDPNKPFITVDEFPKPNTSLEILAKLKPSFKKDGTITAGNSSGLNDGAAAVVLMTETKAKQLNLKPMARITAYASAGVDPKLMGTGPIAAVKKCLEKAKLTVNDLDLIEANEAFAAQAVAVNRTLGWDLEKVNVNGGAIAIGHPIGASGTRLLVTLLYEMIKRDVKRGLATLCIGGGMGTAIIIER